MVIKLYTRKKSYTLSHDKVISQKMADFKVSHSRGTVSNTIRGTIMSFYLSNIHIVAEERLVAENEKLLEVTKLLESKNEKLLTENKRLALLITF